MLNAICLLLIFYNYFLNSFCEVITIYGGLNDNSTQCTGDHQLKYNSEVTVVQFLFTSNLDENHHFCKFKVQAQANMGIFVVINSLKLRMKETGECINYIQFRAKNSTLSKKFCYQDPIEKIFSAQKLSDFNDPQGEIEVIIYITRYTIYEQIVMEINFKMYFECDLDNGDVRMCAENGCIINYNMSELFNTKFNHCPLKKCNCSFSRLKLLSKWRFLEYLTNNQNNPSKSGSTTTIEETKKDDTTFFKYIFYILVISIILGCTSLYICCKKTNMIKLILEEVRPSQEIINSVPPENIQVPHNLPIEINVHNNQEQNLNTGLNFKPPDYENLPQPPAYETLFPTN